MYTVWVQNERDIDEIKAYTFETENPIKAINTWWSAFKKSNPFARIINIHPAI